MIWLSMNQFLLLLLKSLGFSTKGFFRVMLIYVLIFPRTLNLMLFILLTLPCRVRLKVVNISSTDLLTQFLQRYQTAKDIYNLAHLVKSQACSYSEFLVHLFYKNKVRCFFENCHCFPEFAICENEIFGLNVFSVVMLKSASLFSTYSKSICSIREDQQDYDVKPVMKLVKIAKIAQQKYQKYRTLVFLLEQFFKLLVKKRFYLSFRLISVY